jgi:hypothetical protein
MRLRAWHAAALFSTAALLNAAVIKSDDTHLRAGCAEDSDVRATVPAGAPVTIRSMMSGESVPCYKVAVTVDGKTVEGYVNAESIGGLEEFDRGRRDAELLDWNQVMGAFHLPGAGSPAGGGPPGALTVRSSNLAAKAAALIEASQPLKALSMLEPELKKQRDPDLLALAGAAAWRADDTGRALEYWRGSLELHPNPELQALYARLQRETQNDRSTDKLLGMRVQLRYEASMIPAETARQMLGALDQEYGRITLELGCPAEERVIAIAQSREAYRAATQTAEWSGGLFDGRIRVPVAAGAQAVDPELRRTLAHEMVHACLSMLGQWPSWLQEGVAQKLSGDRLSPAVRKKITELTSTGRLPGLNDLGRDWSHLDAEQAQGAYAMSLAAVELFYENYGGLGLRNLLRSPEKLPDITADLDRRLKQ